jgi:hypothetical protein
MENNNSYYDKQYLEDEESGFDVMEWVSYFLHHWYLFVIGIILSLGLAYLENRSWLPSYQSAGTMLIEEGKSGGGAAGRSTDGGAAGDIGSRRAQGSTEAAGSIQQASGEGGGGEGALHGDAEIGTRAV